MLALYKAGISPLHLSKSEEYKKLFELLTNENVLILVLVTSLNKRNKCLKLSWFPTV